MGLPPSASCPECCECPTPTVEWDSRSASKSKCGFVEYGPPSFPPKFYRTSGYSGTISELNAGIPTGDYQQYSGVFTFTSPDCGDDPSPSSQRFAYWAGTVNCGNAVENHPIPSSAIVNASGVPFAKYRPNVVSGSCVPGQFNVPGEYTVDVAITGTTATYTATGADASGTVVATSSNEYTTPQLKSNTLAALPPFPGTWSGTPGSYFDLTLDELTNSIRESRYRFRFKIPKVGRGTCYKITWKERFTPETGDPVDTDKCVIWSGAIPSGYDPADPTTYPIIGDGGGDYYSVPVPGTNGTTTVEEVVAVCRGCGAGCP